MLCSWALSQCLSPLRWNNLMLKARIDLRWTSILPPGGVGCGVGVEILFHAAGRETADLMGH